MVTRYLSGLCVAGLGLCAGGWLVVAAVAFGGQGGEAGRVNVTTGAGLVLAACVTAVAWTVAWRRRMRADGVLGGRFLLVSKREARRNRRELARDIRRTARQAKRAARRARRDANRPADDEFLGETAALGSVVCAHEPNGDALPGREPGARGLTSAELTRLMGTGRPGFGDDEYQGGHDGASAVDVADVLGEVRTLRILLAPLLAGSEPALVPWVRAQHEQAAQHQQAARLDRAEGPDRSRPAAAPLAGDDELLRVADGEEAWW